MKRSLLTTLAVCLMLGCLAGCKGGSQSSEIEKLWKAAKKAESMESYASYIVEQQEEQAHIQEVALETLNGESSMEQQFQATALLCAVEYQTYLSEQENGNWKKDFFKFDYPVSASYANSYLAKVNTEGETFWTSFEEAFYPYDCLMPMIAAADELEGQTLVNLLSGVPEDSSVLKTEMEDAVEEWILNNPGKLTMVGDALIESGYFDEWSKDDWHGTFFYSSLEPYQIREETLKDALAYLNYLKNTVIPTVEGKFGEDSFKNTSELTQEEYYMSNVMVSVNEEVALQDGASSQETVEGDSGIIEIEGKKVIALYRNLQGEDFDDAPPSLRLMGDFMLELPEEEYPATVEETDYYLVLTANYEEGGFYQNTDGSETAIREINSSTSVDLYDAETGTLLRRLGNVLETAPESIFTSDEEGAMYPETVGADVLSFIYHHINEPETYVSLMDHLSGKSEVAIGEPVTLAGWEITYHSAEIVKTFEDSLYVYSPNDGCRFVKGQFTIINKGMEEDTFLPWVYYTGEDPIVQVTDESHENFYDFVNVMNYKKCLGNTTLEPGESKDGELIFEVPEEVAQGEAPLFIAVSLGNRMVYYPLK